jgi:hypothetical protein
MTATIPGVGEETLERLAALEDVELADDLDAVGEQLGDVLDRYTELELRSDARRIDLITLTKSPAAISDYVGVLEQRGIAAERVDPLSELGRFGVGSFLGMKLPVAGPVDSGELYVRGAMPLEETLGYLDRRPPDSGALETIEQVGNVLEKDHTHMLAADVGNPPQFTCMFTQWLDENDDDWLQEVCDLLELPSGVSSELVTVHEMVGARRPMTVYLSVPVPPSGQPTHLKLDYPDVRLGLAAETATMVTDDETATRLLEAGEILDASMADYLGVLVGPDGFDGMRTYVTRHSSRER